MSVIAGIVLAAGQGRRMGRPKALLTHPGGVTFLESACDVLRRAGCAPVVAVLGAEAETAQEHLRRSQLVGEGSERTEVVINRKWQEGMSTSLRAGLMHVQGDDEIEAAVIHLVDLPGVGEHAIGRLLDRAARDGAGALLRASYEGVAGHPVVIGREHWAGVLATLAGDAGARAYLGAHPPRMVEVGDLATGRDVDTPEDRLNFEAE